MDVTWSEHAKEDLREILTYIQRQSERNADLVLQRIEISVSLLGTMPNMGRPGKIAGTRTLVIPKTGYIVDYRLTANEVRIVRIQRGTRL